MTGFSRRDVIRTAVVLQTRGELRDAFDKRLDGLALPKLAAAGRFRFHARRQGRYRRDVEWRCVAR